MEAFHKGYDEGVSQTKKELIKKIDEVIEIRRYDKSSENIAVVSGLKLAKENILQSLSTESDI